MRFYFIRHGESTANLEHIISNRSLPHPLTEKGRQQAAELASVLCPQAPIRLYHSPVPRAEETAQILAAAWQPAEIAAAEALREYDLGIYEGQGSTEAWDFYMHLLDEWYQRGNLQAAAPGGESWLDIRARFQPWLAGQIAALEKQPGSAVFVSHGGLYRLMLPEAAANLPKHYPLDHPLSNTGVIEAEPAQGRLSILRYQGVAFSRHGPPEER